MSYNTSGEDFSSSTPEVSRERDNELDCALAFQLQAALDREKDLHVVLDGAEANEQEVCTICFDKPPTAQLCHITGQSCQCCCGDCGDRLKAEGLPCPMCRRKIAMVIKQRFTHSVRAMA
jgi:hypothetical protein